MGENTPNTILRSAYQFPPFIIEKIDLTFDLHESRTVVTSQLSISRNPNLKDKATPLRLDGEELELISLSMDGNQVPKDAYSIGAGSLTLYSPPEQFNLEIVTQINPAANTKLEGLYLSGGNFCTQCEAEGFRRITYFPDRPDVLALYCVTLKADREKFPVLLSNGNLIEQGELQDGRHYAFWQDPFPKPSYLFALVAGDLAKVEDSYETVSGRRVDLRIFVEHGNEEKCAYAMDSLKRSMKWDEEVYGLEYDLDLFNIVAVGDFNMGAMENKSLNIFNSKYVLADAETATDADYTNIEGIVAHEYFHNWTGNRVTCRDWFQLSLKEGLTVFRDQEFSADMRSKPVQRIGDVRQLRGRQFPEDGGPLAHPIRPDSYMEINNFYTATVYEKGAEVIRMMHGLLGAGNFRKGMDLYFERHDGQAVTCDDFVSAMADASGIDLDQFKRWYGQAGTPVVKASWEHDANNATFVLTLEQSTPPTPGQEEKLPLHIPLKAALLGGDGTAGEERLIQLQKAKESFTFGNCPEVPVLSLNRGFTAPIQLRAEYSDEDLAFLMANDNDPFARWEAGQQYATKLLLNLAAGISGGEEGHPSALFIEAIGRSLVEERLDKAFIAQAIALPDEDFLAEQMDIIDVEAIHRARKQVKKAIAERFQAQFAEVYNSNQINCPYEPTAEQAGQRALRNAALGYLAALETDHATAMVFQHYKAANNMTDTMAALVLLNDIECPAREEALDDFYRRFKGDANVVDKWLALQGKSELPGTLKKVKALLDHEAFSIKNPNKVRALVGVFAMANTITFHSGDGSGYRFLSDRVIELNEINPQIAARLLQPLGRWRKYDAGRGEMMKRELARVLETPNLARDIFEIATKSLGKKE